MTTIDREITRARLPQHSQPKEIAALLKRVALAIENDGTAAEDMVSLLAARGWARGTLGDGGARSSDSTTSVERAADPQTVDRWAGKDVTYHERLKVLEDAARRFEGIHGDVMAQGTDDDPLPAGTGSCGACARECRPSAEKPGNRLVAGLCPTCYRAWRRYQLAEGPDAVHRAEWVSRRREGYTERDLSGAVIRVHTPEPDHDIDLSIELQAAPR